MIAPCGGILLDENVFEIKKDKTITIKGGTGDVTQLAIKVDQIDGRLAVVEEDVANMDYEPIPNSDIDAMFADTTRLALGA